MTATIYIPHHNGYDMLRETLDSLRVQTVPTDVVVVDNGSVDGSSMRIRREFPEVDLIELGRNHGFGRALNLAVRRAPAQTMIFLNNDVVLEPQFVAALLEQRRPGVGSVAGVLFRQDNPGVIASAGIVIDQALTAYDYLYNEPALAAADAAAPLGPTGAAALYELDAFNAAGGFDERIFAYLEDVDLVLRARAAGVRCAFAPHARGLHRQSATLGPHSPRKLELTGYSRSYLLRRYGVLRDRRRAVKAIARETLSCALELAVDRTSAGIRARPRGWRAASGLERHSIPDGLLELSLFEGLRYTTRWRRLGSREMLRRRLAGVARRLKPRFPALDPP